MRTFLATICFGIALLLAACGGGGGGGGGGSPAVAPGPAGPNVQAISIDQGPATNSFVTVNIPYVSVTLCAPGSGSCQTIDHVLVDTGSTGLRILASALNVALPQQTNGSGVPIASCAQFAHSYSWGAVKTADLKISGEQASSLPIQVIGDSGFPNVPSTCSSIGPAMNTTSALGANGILGVGVFRQDCGNACVSGTTANLYFTCPNGSSSCQSTTQPLAQQITNPVSLFAGDNNGTLIQLPAIGSNGNATATGSLIFGIGTRTNNGLGSAVALGLNPSSGTLSVTYKGTTYNTGFIDSGSNAIFLNDSSIPTCASGSVAADFSCPNTPLSLSASNSGTNTSGTVGFAMANAVSLFQNNPSYAAFSNLGGPGLNAATFDWGLPFFYGRQVFTALEGANTPAGNGPYVAY
ncbi:DUF3443 domain-containing protein [Neisseriaceae bacterium JH1-16]|nr:DUF3443 domain-containing protein [Neisseriaceae bacterium JH1-16]